MIISFPSRIQWTIEQEDTKFLMDLVPVKYIKIFNISPLLDKFMLDQPSDNASRVL